MKLLPLSIAAGGLLAVAAVVAADAPATLNSVKPGEYVVDAYHTQIGFTLSHFGFSNYTGLFSGGTGNLRLDPGHPAASHLVVSIPVESLVTTVPKLTDELKGDKWFDSTRFPQATFESTSISVAANGDATIAGNLTLHGVTKPLVLHAHLVGAGVNPIDHQYTVGFQASGTIKRTDFGVSLYAPAIGDDVQLSIAGAFELKG